MDTSFRFRSIDIVRHRRDGHERITLYFPQDLRALDFTPEEAKDFAKDILELLAG